MTGPLARARELRALVDELAAPAWRRDPAWWGLLGAAAVLEPFGRRAGTAYLTSNAEPSHDTFMGAARPGPIGAAAWIAWAVTVAHAAVGAIAAHDGALPGQPLGVTIALDRGVAAVVPVEDPWRVGFAIGARVMFGRIDPRGARHDGDLVRALARELRGVASQLTTTGPRPAVVVAIGDDAIAGAHHGHRRAWTDRGGPWLGVARADGLTLVSTCHRVVDGFGHALIARAVVDAEVDATLRAEADAVLGDAAVAEAAPLPSSAGESLDIAWRRLPPLPGFTHLGYALGRVLHRIRGDAAARCSPCFQLPVAPGATDDPARFTHRVRPALLSVRFPDGRPEPFADFAARAKRAVAREANGGGLVSRLLFGLAAIPVPVALKRRVLIGAPSRWASGPTELIAGDGCLSLLRLPGDAPLVAVSAPPPQIPRTRASSVLTVVRDATGATVTLAAAGPIPARDLLDAWLALLADSPAGAAR